MCRVGSNNDASRGGCRGPSAPGTGAGAGAPSALKAPEHWGPSRRSRRLIAREFVKWNGDPEG